MKILHCGVAAWLLVLVSLDFALGVTTTTSVKPPSLKPKRRQVSPEQRDLALKESARALESMVGRLFITTVNLTNPTSIIDTSFLTSAISDLNTILQLLQNATTSGNIANVITALGQSGLLVAKFIIPKLFVVGAIAFAIAAIVVIVIPKYFGGEDDSSPDFVDDMFHRVQHAIDTMFRRYGKRKQDSYQQQNNYAKPAKAANYPWPQTAWDTASSGSGSVWGQPAQSGTVAAVGYKQPYEQQQQSSNSYPTYNYSAKQSEQPQYRRQGAAEQSQDSASIFPPEVTNEVRALKGK